MLAAGATQVDHAGQRHRYPAPLAVTPANCRCLPLAVTSAQQVDAARRAISVNIYSGDRDKILIVSIILMFQYAAPVDHFSQPFSLSRVDTIGQVYHIVR